MKDKNFFYFFAAIVVVTLIGLYFAFRANRFSFQGYMSLNQFAGQIMAGQQTDFRNFVTQPQANVQDEDICRDLFKVNFANIENRTIEPNQIYQLGLNYTVQDGSVNFQKCVPFVTYEVSGADQNVNSIIFNYRTDINNLWPIFLHYSLQDTFLKYQQNSDGSYDMVMNTNMPYGQYISGPLAGQPAVLVPGNYQLDAMIDGQAVGEVDFVILGQSPFGQSPAGQSSSQSQIQTPQ